MNSGNERGNPDLSRPSWQGFVYVSEAIVSDAIVGDAIVGDAIIGDAIIGDAIIGDAIDNLGRSGDQATPLSTEIGRTLHTKVFPLSTMQAGDRIRIVSLNCGEADSRLMGMGLMPGVVLDVISCTAGGSVMVALQDQRLGLGAEMAQHIRVMDAEQRIDDSSHTSTARRTTMQSTPETPTTKLRDAAIGSLLRVIGYEPTARDYKRKLLAMGLTPGTELRITRHAPLGDPTAIEVRGFHLSLRKDEANALVVEPVALSLNKE